MDWMQRKRKMEVEDGGKAGERATLEEGEKYMLNNQCPLEIRYFSQ